MTLVANTFERVRHVTLPTFKIEIGVPVFVRLDSQIFEGRERQRNGKTEKPARVVSVTNLQTGEQGQLVLGTVLEGNLSEKYPDKSYVGLCFEIVKYEKEGKDSYHKYDLFEVKDPGTQAKPLNADASASADKGKGKGK